MENQAYKATPEVALSLVICSKNRAASLARCFEHIRQNRPAFKWELILVDNGSTDNTRDVMLAFIESLDVPAKYIYEAKRGNGAGRNTAIEQCRGEIIAFTDDDCYLDSNFLTEVEKVFRDPQLGYMSGRIMLFDKTDMPVTINESLDSYMVGESEIAPGGLVQGANMAFRKKAIVEAGMFDLVFGAGAVFAGEDWELAMRISANGWKGGYFADPFVWHHHGRKADAAKKLLTFYWVGEGAVYAKGLLNKKMRPQVFRMMLKALHLHEFWRHKRTLWHISAGFLKYMKIHLIGKTS
jgi:glycosyltransferase involved in cell wall biosynthesis